MINFTSKDRYDFADLQRLVEVLRAPGGCPWDGAQTHLSIRRNFLEEAYEACEGFDLDDASRMREELGDVLLQVLFHTDIERAAGRFDLNDVCDAECKKLIFRHPALFGGEAKSWDEVKQQEKGQTTVTETLDSVARSLPATWRSEKIQKKAFSPICLCCRTHYCSTSLFPSVLVIRTDKIRINTVNIKPMAVPRPYIPAPCA